MAYTLPPAPPVPRTKEQQQTAYSNASYWSDWYNKVREIINLINVNIAGLVSKSEANIPLGYAALNLDTRIEVGADVTDDLIVDDTTRGLVLKSPGGTYFRAQISDAGVLSWVNLGSSKP